MINNTTGNYRWAICTLLFFATTINYLDRQVLGLLKPVLEMQYGWTEQEYSYIVMAFSATYAIGLVVFGRVVDRIGAKTGYTISVTIWSLAAMCHALVTSSLGFGIARAALGIGESGNFPAAVKTVTEWFPKRERALATGIFDSGSNIGACVAPILVPWLLGTYGWQAAFIITGAVGFIWLLAWRLIYQQPEKNARLSASELAYIRIDDEPKEELIPAEKIPWTRLFTLKPTWSFIMGKFLTDPIWYFFLFWLPSYFSTTFNLDLKKPGLPLVIVYSAATVGAIGGGLISSWFIQKGWSVSRSRKTALLISALCVVPIIGARFVSDMWVAVGLIGLAVAGNAGWSSNIYTIVSDMLPKSAVSSVIGIGGMAGAIGGVLFPLFIGYTLDFYKEAGDLIAGYNVIFIVCGVSFLIAWLTIHFITPRMKPVEL
ncbi:Hexuronate transporter [Dyadobacter sp. CECT 9275]|uniref:Hexuronate transporter n=1 Tax=Dyadobacter helix TaxID=2822344 RepID=A0A916NLW4_9BACT|nr:MFS transporter [Dyadobacter sp. CECT 9275]CAG5003095.1 Hexuronate transporter [Dyadobacter sp. CECT 9275]